MKKKPTKSYSKLIIYLFLTLVGSTYFILSPLATSYKFDAHSLQLSNIAKKFLTTDLKKGLVIGRTTFERVDKEAILTKIKENRNKIDSLKKNENSQADSSEESINLEKQITVLEKLHSIDVWFYLDPNSKIQTTFDDENIPLLATWPLEKVNLLKLKSKFDVVVLDPGVYQYIEENDEYFRIRRKEGLEFLQEKDYPRLINLHTNTFHFLKDVMSTLNVQGLFLCDESILENLSISSMPTNTADIILRKIVLKGTGCEDTWIKVDQKEGDWVLPHKRTKEKVGRNWVGVSGWGVFRKSYEIPHYINAFRCGKSTYDDKS